MKLRVDEIKDAKGNIMFYDIGPENDLHRFAIVFLNECIGVGGAEAKEYAQLFACAPEMREMLNNYLSDLRNVVPESPARNNRIENLKQLIEKATTV